MSKTPHSHFPEHTPVLVIMKDGSRFVARFARNEGKGHVEFSDHDPVRLKNVRAMTYYKPTGRPLKGPL